MSMTKETAETIRKVLHMETPTTASLSQVEFTDLDCLKAQNLARHLGYGDNTAYTSSSALVGLFCMATPNKRGGCIIKTKELGFMFVQTADEIGVEL